MHSRVNESCLYSISKLAFNLFKHPYIKFSSEKNYGKSLIFFFFKIQSFTLNLYHSIFYIRVIILMGFNAFKTFNNKLPNCSNELQHDKTNKLTSAPCKDSDQPEHPPNLIRVFAVRMKKPWVLPYPLSTQRRLWSDWANAQTDLSLRCMHRPYCWFCCAEAQIYFNVFSEAFSSNFLN